MLKRSVFFLLVAVGTAIEVVSSEPELFLFNASYNGNGTIVLDKNGFPVPTWVAEKQDIIENYLARSFYPTKLEDDYSWCQRVRRDGNGVFQGLNYIHVPKTGGSTGCGIARRISYFTARAESEGRQLKGAKSLPGEGRPCSVVAQHASAGRVGHYFNKRNRAKAFFWATVRDPAARSVSRAFFTFVKEKNPNPPASVLIRMFKGLDNTQSGLVSKGTGGFQLQYLSFEAIEHHAHWNRSAPGAVVGPREVERHVWRVLRDYDFLMVTERLEESLVALQLLLGLAPGDLLHLSPAKAAGHWAYNFERRRCRLLPRPPRPLPPGLARWLGGGAGGGEFYAREYGDHLLHAAASASLDRTVAALGQGRFARALAAFRALRGGAGAACRGAAVPACAPDGAPQPGRSVPGCYHQDQGCGYRCIDEYLRNHSSALQQQ